MEVQATLTKRKRLSREWNPPGNRPTLSTLTGEAIKAYPKNSALFDGLAELFERQGKTQEALLAYRQGIEAHPTSIYLHARAADWLKKSGRNAEWVLEIDRIVSLCQEELRSKPEESIHFYLARIYQSRGRREEARTQFLLSFGLSKSFLGLNSTAMEFAASVDPRDRDGELAVEAATKACQLSAWRIPMCLDTLANAYAKRGDFDSAVKWQNKAIELLFDKNEQEDFKRRLQLYQQKKPYHYDVKLN